MWTRSLCRGLQRSVSSSLSTNSSNVIVAVPSKLAQAASTIDAFSSSYSTITSLPRSCRHTSQAVSSPVLSSSQRIFSARPSFPLSSPASSVAVPSRSLLKDAREGLRAQHASKLRRFKATTPSLRHTVLVDRSQLWKGRAVHALTVGLRKTGGRSSITGHITVRHRGGGSKRLYRVIDFKRRIHDHPGTVERIEYDPNRSAFIALIAYQHTAPPTLAYIIAPDGLQPGDTIVASRTTDVEQRVGNACPIGLMPVGAVFHCMELRPGGGAQLARGAGTACTLIDKNTRPGYALVELSSKEQRYVDMRCLATVGQVSNAAHQLQKYGKAGRMRNKGRRPHVRGVAMNPVDHPMGGGGGKKKGTHSKSPTGVLAKGYKTRHKRKPRDMIVVARGGIKKGERGGFAGAAAGKA